MQLLFVNKVPFVSEGANRRGSLALALLIFAGFSPSFAQTPVAVLVPAKPEPRGRVLPTVMSASAAGRILDQATWGPTADSIGRLRNLGLNAWLAEQFSLNTSDLPDQVLLDSTGNSNNNIGPVQAAFFSNAVSGDDQLRQRVAFALSQIWVVSHQTVNPAYAFPPYWRIFRDNAFGNYRDVIRAVSLNPAMGRYLNMANNNKGNTAKGTSANENYSRELMQLFTLGLVQLNPDGSTVLDSSKNPVDTYTQADVTNLAKALTGWTYPTVPGATAKTNNPAYYTGVMFAVEAQHDTSAKAIFGGVNIPVGQTAEQDLESVIDALMQQPAMAPFVSKQLIQHLVSSNPSPAYVTRVSSVFTDNGQGVRGDLKAVVTAILSDVDARAADETTTAPDPNFGHLREPILFMTSLLRGLSGTVNASSTLNSRTSALGEDLFNAASVFSYFSPQFRLSTGLLAPEFQIHSTQTAALRADYVNTAVYGTLDTNTKVNLSTFVTADANLDNLIQSIGFVFLHGNIPADLNAAMHSAASSVTAPLDQVKAALYIALTSNDYQVIH